MADLKISVAVPVYDTEKFLPGCIDSILAQSVGDLEIIIVDDGSPGNVRELWETSWKADPRVKLVSHDENRGLFQTRVTGMEHAAGEWIAFVDADDMVSPDRFRLMIDEGRRQDADMVWGDCVHLTKDGKVRRINSIPENRDEPLESPELQKLFFEQAGSDYEWHTVWSKIYRKDLAAKMLPLMKRQTRHLVMCEDVAVSVCAFVAARKMAFAHGGPYYYNKLNDDASTCVRSFDSIQRTLEAIRTAYSFSAGIVRQYLPEYVGQIGYWKERLLSYWVKNVNDNPALSSEEKDALLDNIRKQCAPVPVSELASRLMIGWANEKAQVLRAPDLDDIRREIADPRVKLVSFDIFDTLVVRPFYWPHDLFILVGNDFRKKFNLPPTFMFQRIRMAAEKRAREKDPAWEPGLDAVYHEFQLMTGLSDDEIAYCKNRELELELQYCRPRKAAHILYEYALALGKPVVATSDMYLPEEFLKKMLSNCGYHDLGAVYVSCASGRSKGSGAAYKYLSDLYRLAPDEIVHIGDNYFADVESPRKIGIRSVHFRKPVEILEEQYGKLFRPFGNQGCWSLHAFLGIRCMLAQIACKLFDDPSQNMISGDTVFGGSIQAFGYFGLGMHLLALVQWIQKTAKTHRISGIHFLYRDGCLPSEAYNIIYGDSAEKVPNDTWYLNRKIASRLWIGRKEDLAALYHWEISFTLSIDNIVNVYRDIIPPDMMDAFVRHFSKKIDPKQEFSEEQKVRLLRFIRRVYDKISPYFDRHSRLVAEGLKKKLFGDNDATFDVGYSLRSESCLNRLGIRLSALYLHINQDFALERAKNYAVDIHTFYDFLPLNTGVIRELCFSDAGPRCEGYKIENGDLVPVFAEKADYRPDESLILRFIQYAALEFVRDWKDTFADRMDELYYRFTEASRFFEQFLHLATERDMDIMRPIPFDDQLGVTTMANVANFWQNQNTLYASQFKQPENPQNAEIRAELERLRAEQGQLLAALTGAQMELQSRERSLSFIVGRILTWPLRMVRNIFRCWREHGFAYTCGRIPVKIHAVAKRIISLPGILGKK